MSEGHAFSLESKRGLSRDIDKVFMKSCFLSCRMVHSWLFFMQTTLSCSPFDEERVYHDSSLVGDSGSIGAGMFAIASSGLR